MTPPTLPHLPELIVPMLPLGLGLTGEFAWHGNFPMPVLAVAIPILFGAVFATVHHAETIAHRIEVRIMRWLVPPGEPTVEPVWLCRSAFG